MEAAAKIKDKGGLNNKINKKWIYARENYNFFWSKLIHLRVGCDLALTTLLQLRAFRFAFISSIWSSVGCQNDLHLLSIQGLSQHGFLDGLSLKWHEKIGSAEQQWDIKLPSDTSSPWKSLLIQWSCKYHSPWSTSEEENYIDYLVQKNIAKNDNVACMTYHLSKEFQLVVFILCPRHVKQICIRFAIYNVFDGIPMLMVMISAWEHVSFKLVKHLDLRSKHTRMLQQKLYQDLLMWFRLANKGTVV